MRPFRRAALLPALLLALAPGGCMRLVPEREVIRSWVGEPIGAAIAAWGPPSEGYAAGPNRVAIWREPPKEPPPPSPSVTFHFSTGLGGPPGAPAPATGGCERVLEAGPDGRIVGGEVRGSGCPLYEDADRSRWLNPRRR